MIGLFFTVLACLSLLAATFVGIAWAKHPRKQLWLPLAFCILLFIFSGFMYFWLGKSVHIIYQKEDTALRQIAELLDDTMPLSPQLHQEIKTELEKQQERAGAQPTVWLLMAQLAMREQDYAAAKMAYQQAYQYLPDDADIAISYAQAWYLADHQKKDNLLDNFLLELQKKYPDKTGLLNLLAVMAYNKSQYQQAIYYWQQVLVAYPAESIEAQAVKQMIEEAKQK